MPLSIVGAGPTLNVATDNGFAFATKLVGETVPEIMNRTTISGSIEIGRHPVLITVALADVIAS